MHCTESLATRPQTNRSHPAVGAGPIAGCPTGLASLIRCVRDAKALHASPARQLSSAATALARFAQHAAPASLALPALSTGLYVRRRLTDPGEDFQLIAAFWGPRSASPVHDHDEVTGAVTALQGTVTETRYAVRGRADHRLMLQATGSETMALGGISAILPGELEQHHDMRNDGDRPAITLHLYLRPLRQFRVYEACDEGGYRAQSRTLWFD